MHQRSAKPAGSSRANQRRGPRSFTLALTSLPIGLWLANDPPGSTVDPRSGNYLGDFRLR
jgi:hypothetical protein